MSIYDLAHKNLTHTKKHQYSILKHSPSLLHINTLPRFFRSNICTSMMYDVHMMARVLYNPVHPRTALAALRVH